MEVVRCTEPAVSKESNETAMLPDVIFDAGSVLRHGT